MTLAIIERRNSEREGEIVTISLSFRWLLVHRVTIRHQSSLLLFSLYTIYIFM